MYINFECFESKGTPGHGWEGFQEKGEEFILIKRQDVSAINCSKKVWSWEKQHRHLNFLQINNELIYQEIPESCEE